MTAITIIIIASNITTITASPVAPLKVNDGVSLVLSPPNNPARNCANDCPSPSVPPSGSLLLLFEPEPIN